MMKSLRAIIAIYAALSLPVAEAAVARVDQDLHTDSTAWADATPVTSGSWSIASGVTLLAFAASRGQMFPASTALTWNVASPESFTLVGNSTASGSSSDVVVSAWCIEGPTAATDDVTISYSGGDSAEVVWFAVLQLTGVDSNGCATDITELAEDVDNTASTNMAAFSSAGSAGNAGFIACAGAGDDSSPMSNSGSWTEVYDTNTGGGSPNPLDLGIYVIEVYSLPAATTVTLADTDEHACVYMSVAAAASLPIFRRRWE